MKIFVAFTLLLFVTFSTGKLISKVYNSIDEFKAKNPGVKLIKMDVFDHELDGSRTYSLGARQTGDVVVANANNKKSWPVSQNVTTTLTYPTSGANGAFLTYILINCEQSSNLGQAYVSYGGIGQHFIQIIVQTQVTTYFNYAAFFYGIK